MLMLPLRVAACGFAVAVNVIDASPCPEIGDTCSHDASLFTAHAHSRSATTLVSTRPPLAGMAGLLVSVV